MTPPIDDSYDFYVCSRLSLVPYDPARCPDFTRPPQLFGFGPSYFPAIVTPHLSPYPTPSFQHRILLVRAPIQSFHIRRVILVRFFSQLLAHVCVVDTLRGFYNDLISEKSLQLYSVAHARSVINAGSSGKSGDRSLKATQSVCDAHGAAGQVLPWNHDSIQRKNRHISLSFDFPLLGQLAHANFTRMDLKEESLMPQTVPSRHVDIFICGGGPVGLLTAYQLTRVGLSTYTVERFDKTQQAMYGRASLLYPRTLEMLGQLDLMDEMSQVGFIGRGSVTFKDGERIHGRGWGFISRMYDTFFDYCLSIRQKYSEDIFRNQLERIGGRVNAGTTLEHFYVEPNSDSEYPVVITVKTRDGSLAQINAKYIVGADGSKSTVRRLAGIKFEGERTKHHWIRIDAVVETDMPDARIGFGAIESSTHGNVLWVALDHGRTRIGFAMDEETYEKYGHDVTQDFVMEEAQKAMKPFSLKFVSVDWWTLYSIGQRLAETLQKGRIILAGDSGHTHSSGAAQGMNTGLHDAINLAWKLAGVSKGWYKPEVLTETYSSERLAVAERLIGLDKSISALISGTVPKDMIHMQTTDVNMLLDDLLESSSQFTTGLGITYPIDHFLNECTSVASIQAGQRGPDVLLQKPGSRLPTRLFALTTNNAKFWIVVFAGDPHCTKQKLKQLRTYLDSPGSFKNRLTDAFNFLTIIATPGLQPDETLGVNRFGHAYYDVDHSAHRRYGIAASQGGVVVLRPDGILGFAAAIDEGPLIASYFGQFVLSQADTHSSAENIDVVV